MSIKNENSPKASNKQSLVGLAKSVLVEQHQRLAYKNNVELEILEDLYKFLKSRCQIETHYNQQMVKLAGHYLQRKPVSLKADPHSDAKALYPAWRGYLGQTERCSKDRLQHFEQMLAVVDQLKQMKTHKHQIIKKTMDTYFKKAQDDVLASLSEIDKCRKLYFDEEHYANQARDKEEKIKKRKLGILSKFTDMQSKKEKSSAQKEASEIQSTQARNEYILALAAGNAHLEHYFNVELAYLLDILEDNTVENAKEVLIKLIDREEKCQTASATALKDCLDYLHKVTAAFTHLAFLTDPSNTSLSERLQIDFEPCENDNVTEVSLEHNAAFALEHEVNKWTTCFSKETRNVIKIDQQLAKCFKLQSAGKKQVEVNGVGQMDLDQRIEDLKLQKRKCDLNKTKARARLLAMQRGGLNVEDLDAIEMQISNELEEQYEKQQTEKQMLAVNAGGDGEALSRTASLRSTNVSPDLGRISVMENKSQSEERQEFNETPEPMSSENDLSEGQAQQYEDQQPVWNDYDATAAWSTPEPPTATEAQFDDYSGQQYGETTAQQDLVGQYVQALYPYTAQNEDELDIVEGEQLVVVSADEQDWIKVQNSEEKTGFVPFAYVQVIGGEEAATNEVEQKNETNMQQMDSQYSDSYVQSSPVNQYSEETSYTNQQYAYQEENNQDPTITQETTTYTASEYAADQTTAPKADYAIAAYDYEASNDEEISFKEGDRIVILEKSEDGWWLGTNAEGQTGHFPSMLVHCDDDDEEIAEQEEVDESEESTELSFEPPPLPPPAPIGEDSDDEQDSDAEHQEPIKPPSFLAPQPDTTGIVITEPTPDVEHKAFVKEEPKEEEEEEDQVPQTEEVEEAEKEVEEAGKEVRQNYVQTTVEINVFESEKQVFSSDEEDEPAAKVDVKEETKTDQPESKDDEIELPQPSQESEIQVKVEASSASELQNKPSLDDLPPPPPELTAFSPEEVEEDDQLILKRLRQLKDTNNNFTASFDILDDSELTTAENSQSIDESKPDEPADASASNNATTEESKTETTAKDDEKKSCDKEEEAKSSDNFEANFETNFEDNKFEANFDDNFPTDEDLK